MKRVLGQYMSQNMSERIIVSAIMQQLDVGSENSENVRKRMT